MFKFRSVRGLMLLVSLPLSLIGGIASATTLEVSAPRQLVPPNITTTSNKPMMVLAASKDHSLFGPIYTDFEDLDGDGVIDTTFIPTFKYYGYFDATKCYSYNNTSSQFEPSALATIVATVVGSKTLDRYTCTSTQKYWSGNFLNWSSMTRLDVVRKMLYGGTRSTDANGSTVLERAKLNFDAHSFVKYYRGTDIRDYTPFTTGDLTKSSGSNPNVYAGLSICNTGFADSSAAASNAPVMRMVKGNVRFWATVEVQVCRWRESYGSGTFGPKLARYYKDADKGGGVIAHEISIPYRGQDGASYDGIGPELTVRVKVCDPNFLGEEHCQAFPPSSLTNYKPYGLFQEFGYSTTGGAARAEFGVITGSYDLNYTAGALRKNMGDFADEINATTGVFCHSASSGCAASLPSPDGRTTGQGAIKAFDAIILNDRSNNAYAASGVPSGVAEGTLSSWGNPIGEMLVQALQYYAYNGSTPTPTNPASTIKDALVGAPVATWRDPLSNSNTSRTSLYGNSVCRPLNTLLLSNSSLSFDGQASTPFSTLPNTTGNIDSYTNKIGVAEGFNNTLRSIGSVVGGYGDSCSAKTVGTLANVSGICPEAPAMGGTYQVAGAALYGNTAKIRTVTSPPSDLATVKNALKVKTLAASLTGGAPRIDVPVPGTSPVKYVYITPESVQAGGKVSAPLTFASISSSATHGAFIVTWNDILMGGDYDMDITGFLRYDLIANSSSPSGWDIKITTDIPGVCGGGAGTHGFSIIGVQTNTGTSGNGRYLTHQHFSGSALSGMPPVSEYLCGDTSYRNRTSTLFTGTFADTVCNVTGNGATGDPDMPSLVNYCTVKNIDFPVSTTFRMVGESDALIKDPLFYAAKYGAFDSSTKNSDGTFNDLTMPPNVASWDSVTTEGVVGSDGVPDNYFLARRPDLLEQQLRKALDSLAKNANSAPATATGNLTEGSYKYIAKFDSTTVTGNIEAYKAQSNGAFASTATWLAGNKLRDRTSGVNGGTGDNGASRQIITSFYTYTSPTAQASGMPFRWANLPTGYKTLMTTASTNRLSDANAEKTLNYIRGDQTLEAASTGLRERGDNMLGPVVNATPWVQAPPNASYLESQFKGYGAFVTAQKSRPKLLWVAANDGMLHAFCAEDTPSTACSSGGTELFAYVPGVLANRLAEIPLQRGTPARTRLNNANFTLDSVETQPDSTVWAYVDGSPYTADVKTGITKDANGVENGGTWRSYVFGSLGRGGRGMFALDASDANTLAAGESNAGSIFKWQFTSDDDNDFGYIVNDIARNTSTNQPNPVVRLNNGKFAIITGNGYKSLSGKSALFILFVDGPTSNATSTNWNGQYVKIVADSGTGNGLMTPSWIDRNNDGTADVVYAGDLKGNLWKFDISSTDPTAWKVAYTSTTGTPRPLFTAQMSTTVNSVTTVTPLPITTAPEYVYPAFDGLIINFGTGNAFETGDFPKAGMQQRIYGIWDRPSFRAATGTGPMIAAGMSTLVQRNYTLDTSTGVVTATADNTSGGVSTYNGIDWTNKDGWYINLPGTSESLNTNPELVASFLVFQTIRPKTTTENCFDTPNTTRYIIDPIAGIATRVAQGTAANGTFVVGVGVADQKWVTVTNKTTEPYTVKNCTSGANCVNGKTVPTPPSQVCKTVITQNNASNLCYNPLGRVQWREIPGLRTDK